MSTTPPLSSSYDSWTHPALIARISDLERTLHKLTTNDSSPANTTPRRSRSRTRRSRRKASQAANPNPNPNPNSNAAKPHRAFSMSKYSTRHIALRIAYLGGRYNGFEHANGNVTPLPTVEEVLWFALRKTRLIAPRTEEGVGMEVVWGRRRGLGDGAPVSWEGCEWSKAGRTDRGVSAAGQVVGVRVRSRRVPERAEDINGDGEVGEKVEWKEDGGIRENVGKEGDELDDMGFGLGPEDVLTTPKVDGKVKCDARPFDDVKHELPYIMILNAVLPPDIRVLAWCPHPPTDFNARFSCRERRYRYFFTNPGFLPTPGPAGLQDGNGKSGKIREGWLDIDRMREAAQKLLGDHDFRNFCRLDTTKQMTSCQRQIRHVEIEEVSQHSGPIGLTREPQLRQTLTGDAASSSPKVYSFNVHGSSFLWHQVRHMVAVLFLVGQGLEDPSVVDELLDIERNPCKPTYGMASDSPLVLWDCIFPKEKGKMEDGLDWVYAGDAVTLPSPDTKWDGKYGMDGIADELFVAWHERKVGEVIAGSLLDLVIKQGDGSSQNRGPPVNAIRSQKLFDGSANGQLVGKYIPMMQKPRTDTIEVQNERFRVARANRNMLRAKEMEESRSTVHIHES